MAWWKTRFRAAAKPSRFQRRLGGESLEPRCLLSAVANPLAVPQLSSRPLAPATLYLDFNGHVEPQFGSHLNVVTPPYDTDGNQASFSPAEIAAIDEIWARVAEDYAPFNINVTTAPPRSVADRVAARVAIGGSYTDWYGSAAGGVSYVGGFSTAAPNVAYVFSQSLGGGNPRLVAEAASHEAGHLFGLEHQAAWNGSQLVSPYNAGTAAWAPIMGNSYYAARTTWTNGATDAGPTTTQDELATIASSANGFGYAPDDFGNTPATATSLRLAGSAVNASGVIGKSDDRDVFQFTTGGGRASFTVDVAQYGPDLDAVLELENAAGKTLAIASPANSLGASLTATLPAGTYYLAVYSSGGYGNLGRYTLHGNLAAPATTPASEPPSAMPPPSSPPADQPEGEANPPPTTAGPLIVNDGAAAFASSGSWNTLTGIGYSRNSRWSAAGSGASAAWTFTGLPPGQYRLAATWSGSALNAPDAPFAVSSGRGLLTTVKVNQQRSASTFASDGALWQNLGTFTITGNTLTVRLSSSLRGRVVADAIRLERVAATSGGA